MGGPKSPWKKSNSCVIVQDIDHALIMDDNDGGDDDDMMLIMMMATEVFFLHVAVYSRNYSLGRGNWSSYSVD